jgi:hypothetical protein
MVKLKTVKPWMSAIGIQMDRLSKRISAQVAIARTGKLPDRYRKVPQRLLPVQAPASPRAKWPPQLSAQRPRMLGVVVGFHGPFLKPADPPSRYRRAQARPIEPIEHRSKLDGLADDDHGRGSRPALAMTSGSVAMVATATRWRAHVPHSITAAGVSPLRPGAIN